MISLSGKTFIVIDFQWYRFNGNMIPKELATCDDEFRRSHFLFKPIFSFGSMTAEDQRVARYVFSYYHGLKWEDGYTVVGEFDEIIKRLCFGVDLVFVKGREKLEYLKCILDKRIIDLVDAQKIMRGKPSCSFHTGNYVVCAMSNVEALYKFLVDIRLSESKVCYI